MKKRHRKRVNSFLLKKCHEKLGSNFKKMYLVSHLIEAYNAGELEIKQTEPFEKNDTFAEFVLDKIAFHDFNVSLSVKLGRDLRDSDSLNILMYNFITQ